MAPLRVGAGLRRSERKRWLLVGAWIGLCALGVPNFVGDAEPTAVGVLEAPLLVLLLSLAWAATTRASVPMARGETPSARARFRSLPTALRVAGISCALVAVGQIAKSKQLYPFMPLRMYGGEAEGAAEFLIYEAELENGEVRRLRPSRILPDLGAARLTRGLERRLNDLPASDVLLRDRDLKSEERQAAVVLRLLMSTYNEQLPESRAGERVHTVRIVRVHLGPPYTRGAEERTLVGRVALETQ